MLPHPSASKPFDNAGPVNCNARRLTNHLLGYTPATVALYATITMVATAALTPRTRVGLVALYSGLCLLTHDNRIALPGLAQRC